MSPRLRLLVPALLAVVVVIVGLLLAGGNGGGIGAGPGGSPTPGAAARASGGPAGSDLPVLTAEPTPTARPSLGGTELYGYLPYWHFSETQAANLESVPLSTLALFSVSARRTGALDSRDTGYRRITSDLGRRIIAGAHARGTRVELVFTSFGDDKNGVFFGRIPPPGPTSSSSPPPSGAPTPIPTPTPAATPAVSAVPLEPPWHRTVTELVALAVDLGVDGIDADVEQLDELDRDAYGEFLLALRSALRTAIPNGTLTVATEAGSRGVGNARAAATAGVDRLFLMGYDYHWSGSQPGASSPVDRLDGLYTQRWSISEYVEAGVPRDRILLGLPLYGMTWQTTGPDRTSPVIGKGAAWIPNRHLDILLDPGFSPGRDPLEVAEFFVRPDGDDWRVTYYDPPATLRAKLAFARDQGLAGGGFWAIGYERGLPGYLELMGAFRDGKVTREEAPPAPTLP
jgi:hypothetical protein